MPCQGLLHPEPLWQATADPYLHRRHSDTVMATSLWGLWVLVCTRFIWTLWASLVGMGFDSKHDFAPPILFLGLSFALGCGVSFLVGFNILLSMVIQLQIVILEFLQDVWLKSGVTSCIFTATWSRVTLQPQSPSGLRWYHHQHTIISPLPCSSSQ